MVPGRDSCLAAKGGKGPSRHPPAGVRPSPGREMDVPGGSSQALTGEFALSEFHIVFAEVLVSSERMEMLQKSLRETHFEAPATQIEVSWKFGRKSK